MRAHERAEAIIHAAEPIAEVAEALPSRSVNDPAGNFNSNSRSLGLSSPIGWHSQGGSSSDARALPARAEPNMPRSSHPPRFLDHSFPRVDFCKYIENKRNGVVADKDTQTSMQPFPRQPFSRQLQMATPGIWAEHGAMSQMTVYELRTIAKDYALGTSGNKTQLLARIRYYLTTDTGFID